MTIEAQLADGSILEFPDNTPDQVIQNAVRQRIGIVDPQPAFAPGAPAEQQGQQAPVDLEQQLAFAREAQFEAAGVPPEQRGPSIAAQERLQGFPEKREETRAARELPEFGSAGLLAGEDKLKIMALGPALLFTTDPNEIGNILKENFPNIGITQDPGGNILATNNRTGSQVIINRPGISKLDVLQGLGLAAAFTPAARGATLTKGGLTGLAGKTAATQAGIETVQALSGGEFDPSQVALAGALAPIAEFGGQRIIGPVISGGAQAVGRGVSELAAQVVKAGERVNISVLTSDIAKPRGSFTALLRQFSERVPILGTGGVRAKQQLARELAAKKAGQNLGSFTDSEIVQSLKTQSQKVRAAAGKRLETVKNQLGDDPIGIAKTLKSIDDVLDDLTQPGLIPDTEAIQSLQSVRQVLTDNPNSFAILRRNRTIIRELVDKTDAAGRSQAFSSTKAQLDGIRRAMTEDLDDAVLDRLGKKALSRYKDADALWAKEMQRLTKTRLKAVLDKGEITPETVNQLLFSQKGSEVRLLFSALTERGRSNARAAILQKAFRAATDDQGFINPTTLARQLNNISEQVDVFFKGARKEEIQGLQKLFAFTRRAQEAGVATANGARLEALLGLTVAGGAIAQSAIAQTTAAIGGTVALAGRLYESAPVRNFLISMSKVKPGSEAERLLINSSAQKITAFAQTLKPSGTREEVENGQ